MVSFFQLFEKISFAYFCFSRLTSSNVKFCRISALKSIWEYSNKFLVNFKSGISINRPFAARGHVLGYHLATRNWRASVPFEQKPEGQARVVLKKSF